MTGRWPLWVWEARLFVWAMEGPPANDRGCDGTSLAAMPVSLNRSDSTSLHGLPAVWGQSGLKI